MFSLTIIQIHSRRCNSYNNYQCSSVVLCIRKEGKDNSVKFEEISQLVETVF